MTTRDHSIHALLPKSRTMQIAAAIVLVSALLGGIALNSARAVEPSNEHFLRTWQRTDKPIVDGVVSRTWNWGPEAISNEISEPYTDSPGASRRVQYFDKSRMEINDPNADPNSIWFVTNGLLVVELMSGQMQVGDDEFLDRFPAAVPVAGDPNDPNGVTYAVFANFREVQPTAAGTVYTQRLHADGGVTNEPSLAGYNVTADHLDEVTNHRIAGPFWDYMNSTGPVYVDGQFIDDLLFPNAYYSAGRPITEYYWVRSLVGGTERDVGIQCFERRCLTYTPGNSEGFVVEDGNVGLHAFIWRYETPNPTPTATATSPATATAPATSTATATATSTTTATVTATATATMEEFIDVQVVNSVDCDSDGSVDALVEDVGTTGACQEFLGGEILTIQDGDSEGTDEVQELGLNDATGGTISITFDHPSPTTPTIVATGIDWNSTAAQIYAVLQSAFSVYGVTTHTPTVAPDSALPNAQLNEADMLFTFENGPLAGMDVPEMTVNNSPLIGETVAGTFSTLIEGGMPLDGEDEEQRLTPNEATGGTFTLTVPHPDEGNITTGPIQFDASSGDIESALDLAFLGAGVGGDAPGVTGGPAHLAAVDFSFENGALAGVDLGLMTVNNGNLSALVQVSKVEVFDTDDDLLTTWLVDSLGRAQGSLAPGNYEFCLTYTEDTGQSDIVCTGIVPVNALNDEFNLTAELEYS